LQTDDVRDAEGDMDRCDDDAMKKKASDEDDVI
jgi:hypothetical protein